MLIIASIRYLSPLVWCKVAEARGGWEVGYRSQVHDSDVIQRHTTIHTPRLVFGLWEDTGVPTGNPHRHKENMNAELLQSMGNIASLNKSLLLMEQSVFLKITYECYVGPKWCRMSVSNQASSYKWETFMLSITLCLFCVSLMALFPACAALLVSHRQKVLLNYEPVTWQGVEWLSA